MLPGLAPPQERRGPPAQVIGGPRSSRLSRRTFLRLSGGLGGLLGATRVAADPSQALRAVVIGHTGRGDYGHGLDVIFENRPGIQLVGLADPDLEGRARAAARIHAPNAYADYRQMLAQERPQLASIALRQADQHHAIGLACLQAGAHCYFEKPFVRFPAESDELLAEADRRSLRIAVAHTMRMMPQVVRLKQALSEGLLGEVRELRAFGKQDARAGGEDMIVLGSHLFDLLRLFCGDPLWVTARVLQDGRDITSADRRLVKDNVGWVAGDQVHAQFGFHKGVQATFTSDGQLRETTGHWGIEIFGRKGVARINCDLAPNVFLRATTGWSAGGRTDRWEPLDPALLKTPPEANAGPVGDWLSAIANNREPECSGRNGAWAIEMVMGVYRAALGQQRVVFPLVDRQHPLET